VTENVCQQTFVQWGLLLLLDRRYNSLRFLVRPTIVLHESLSNTLLFHESLSNTLLFQFLIFIFCKSILNSEDCRLHYFRPSNKLMNCERTYEFHKKQNCSTIRKELEIITWQLELRHEFKTKILKFRAGLRLSQSMEWVPIVWEAALRHVYIVGLNSVIDTSATLKTAYSVSRPLACNWFIHFIHKFLKFQS